MFVSVDFDIRTTKGSNSVSVEMNKEELKKMILSLEAANKVGNLYNKPKIINLLLVVR